MENQDQKLTTGMRAMISTGIIVFILGIVSSYYFSTTIEKYFWGIRTQSVLEEIRAETPKYLSREVFDTWKEATSSKKIDDFAETIKDSSSLIAGLKIYDTKGIVVWSNMKSATVGMPKSTGMSELNETATAEQITEEAEDAAKNELSEKNLLEVYTSIKTKEGTIIGFAETYFKTTSLLATIQNVRYTVWGTLLVILIIIFTLLRIAFRKQSDLILVQARELGDIFNNSPVGICTTYSGGNILSANARFLKILGIPAEEALLKTNILENRIIKEMKLEAYLREALFGAPFETDASFIKNALTQYVHIRGTPIINPETNKVARLLVTIEDITRRKKLEIEAANYTQNLEKKVTERTQDLEKKVTELEQFQRVTVGRELRMTELKQQIERMRLKLESCGITLDGESYKL